MKKKIEKIKTCKSDAIIIIIIIKIIM